MRRLSARPAQTAGRDRRRPEAEAGRGRGEGRGVREGRRVPAPGFTGMEATAMIGRTRKRGRGGRPPRRKLTWAGRALIYGGLWLALAATVPAAIGGGAEAVAGIWLLACVWAALVGFACALWRGFRRGDWSAFGRYELPDDRGDALDWSTTTGEYSYLRIGGEHERLMSGDYLTDHDYGSFPS